MNSVDWVNKTFLKSYFISVIRSKIDAIQIRQKVSPGCPGKKHFLLPSRNPVVGRAASQCNLSPFVLLGKSNLPK
jgi:hypothetical protein